MTMASSVMTCSRQYAAQSGWMGRSSLCDSATSRRRARSATVLAVYASMRFAARALSVAVIRASSALSSCGNMTFEDAWNIRSAG